MTNTITTLLGSAAPKNLNPKKIAEALNAKSESAGIELSSYGYVMWVLEHFGIAGVYRNMLSASTSIDGYAEAARKYRDDMPALLINASKYVDRVFNTLQDPELCMTRLEGMTYPYVLYVLFASAGQTEPVEKYRPEMEEQLRRYPATLSLLPEKFRAVGEEVLSANTK